MNTMFNVLMGLPLFRGVSYKKMAETVGKSKFHFLKFLADETIIYPGDQCSHITFIISGKVRISYTSADGRLTVAQTLEAPDVVAPDFMFGRTTQYPCYVKAIDDTGILRISKSDYLSILGTDPVFLLNYLNTLSVNAQKSIEGILSISSGNISERIAFWISALTQPRSMNIVLQCRRRDLYSQFGVSRTSFMLAMDDLRNRGLIEYTPTEIFVKSRRAMLDLLLNHSEHSDDNDFFPAEQPIEQE